MVVLGLKHGAGRILGIVLCATLIQTIKFLAAST